MSENDLRTIFPLSHEQLVSGGKRWTIDLIEVSDSRPEQNRLSWYLAFHDSAGETGKHVKKLELVTNARELIDGGWPDDLKERLTHWLDGGESDGRMEWLTAQAG